MRITKQRLKEIIIEEISEHQFGFPSLGLTLADVTPGAKDKPEDPVEDPEDPVEDPEEEEDTPAPAPKEPKKPQRAPTDAEIAAYMARYGGDSYGQKWSSPASNQGSDIKKRPRRYQENKMKITKEQLRQIIKEELESVMEADEEEFERGYQAALMGFPPPTPDSKHTEEYKLGFKEGVRDASLRGPLAGDQDENR